MWAHSCGQGMSFVPWSRSQTWEGAAQTDAQDKTAENYTHTHAHTHPPHTLKRASMKSGHSDWGYALSTQYGTHSNILVHFLKKIKDKKLYILNWNIADQQHRQQRDSGIHIHRSFLPQTPERIYNLYFTEVQLIYTCVHFCPAAKWLTYAHINILFHILIHDGLS